MIPVWQEHAQEVNGKRVLLLVPCPISISWVKSLSQSLDLLDLQRLELESADVSHSENDLTVAEASESWHGERVG